MARPPVSVVIVTFGLDVLDLRFVPPDTPIVLVHNDDRLDDDSVLTGPSPPIEHLRGHGNVGFGAGANLGLSRVGTGRVVFCNPDASLTEEHWSVLAAGAVDELVSVPMVDDDGRPASVINPYPTPIALLLTGYRVGRFAARGTTRRRALEHLLGRWGAAHAASSSPRRGPLTTAWCSGAVLSVDAERVRAIGGFDEGYFLYFEDVDLCRRLGDRFPDMCAHVPPVPPAQHTVGGTAGQGRARMAVERHLVASAIRYAERTRAAGRDGTGPAWSAAIAALRLRAAWLGRR